MDPVTRLGMVVRREWLSLILGAVLIAFCLSLLYGPLGPRDLLALRRHRRALEAERSALAQRNEQLETSVLKLRSDRPYLVHLIRRELGYTRPDEIVYKFADAPSHP
jgi:cell division protein FtsB